MYHCTTLALQEDILGQFVSIKGQEEKNEPSLQSRFLARSFVLLFPQIY